MGKPKEKLHIRTVAPRKGGICDQRTLATGHYSVDQRTFLVPMSMRRRAGLSGSEDQTHCYTFR
jgi:hypothetical protein